MGPLPKLLTAALPAAKGSTTFPRHPDRFKDFRTVAKPELGTKRLCGSCGAKFYDLSKDPRLLWNVATCEKLQRHYARVLETCRQHDLKPFVTFNHFTTPIWFAARGGFEQPDSPELFAAYCERAAHQTLRPTGFRQRRFTRRSADAQWRRNRCKRGEICRTCRFYR